MADPHDVTVDPGRVEQELLLLGEPDPQGRTRSPDPEQERRERAEEAATRPWQVPAQLAAGAFCNYGVPNWNVPPDEAEKLAQAVEAWLDHTFPGGLGGIERMGPHKRLLLTFGSVAVACGIDWQTMTIKPPWTPQAPPGGEGEADNNAGKEKGEAQGEGGRARGFSTQGGPSSFTTGGDGRED